MQEEVRHYRLFVNGEEDLMTLKEWLAHRELSQGEVARRINVRREQVTKWCSGKYAPSGRHLANLCHVLDCQPHEIRLPEHSKTTTSSLEKWSFRQKVVSFVTRVATEMGV